MAERVRFELTLEFPLNTLSKRAPSATRPPLQIGCFLIEFTIATEVSRVLPRLAWLLIVRMKSFTARRQLVYSSALLLAICTVSRQPQDNSERVPLCLEFPVAICSILA